jgi:hypothetical protein
VRVVNSAPAESLKRRNLKLRLSSSRPHGVLGRLQGNDHRVEPSRRPATLRTYLARNLGLFRYPSFILDTIDMALLGPMWRVTEMDTNIFEWTELDRLTARRNYRPPSTLPNVPGSSHCRLPLWSPYTALLLFRSAGQNVPANEALEALAHYRRHARPGARRSRSTVPGKTGEFVASTKHSDTT